MAKKFLEEHPEEMRTLNTAMAEDKRVRIGAPIISSFLNWPESRVTYSLERLKLTEEKKIDKSITSFADLPKDEDLLPGGFP